MQQSLMPQQQQPAQMQQQQQPAQTQQPSMQQQQPAQMQQQQQPAQTQQPSMQQQQPAEMQQQSAQRQQSLMQQQLVISLASWHLLLGGTIAEAQSDRKEILLSATVPHTKESQADDIYRACFVVSVFWLMIGWLLASRLMSLVFVFVSTFRLICVLFWAAGDRITLSITRAAGATYYLSYFCGQLDRRFCYLPLSLIRRPSTR
jgi:Ca2+-dependent lipid-binding protein